MGAILVQLFPPIWLPTTVLGKAAEDAPTLSLSL